jgi:hypothetical protein
VTMTNAETTPNRPRDGWVIAGMTVAAASAAVASFSGLRGLAQDAGWPGRLAWLLPLTVDAYAMTSARVWLAASTHSRRARRFARSNAVGAIVASIAGNAAYHALSVGLLAVSWPIVVLVGAVPAAVLGLTAHLHAVRTLDDPDPTPVETESRTPRGGQSGTRDRTESGTVAGPRSRTHGRSRHRTQARTDEELMTAARVADEQYRAAHDGRPITRDALREALRIAGPRATELRRRLATHATPPEPSSTPERKESTLEQITEP